MRNQKYDMVRFLLKCILIPAAAILIICAMNKPYKEIDSQKYLDIVKFDVLGRQYTEINIGNLGSSHGAYDFNYTDLQNIGYVCFNFANTSQSYNYDYAILKEFGQYMVDGSVLFIPVSYFSFNNEVVNAAEAEAMSIRYYHFLSPENIPDYDPYVDLIANRLPVLSAGKDILKLFPKLETALTAHASNDGIDVEEFARRAQERYSRHFDNKEEYFLPERIEELYAIIDYCKENQITPVLITTPFSQYYTDQVSQEFLQEFHDTVTRIASDTGVNYYDYSHDERFHVNLEYFSDSDHLNEEGALYFTDILWSEVEEMRPH
ncbi:MAG: D-alanyl-lipoteichoic acid biosynthesis protein DltD [Eubacterium sp.]|nr:D-alanyl-lipoteichoic acid biosynthesis protein DltD [Eubacterium sp.]